MASGKATSAAEKARFGVYKSSNQYGKNKIRKLQSHLRKHPDDATAIAALESHSKSVATSPRWGHKKVGNLNASKRLHDQTVSLVNAGLNQLKYAAKATNAIVLNGKLSSDQIVAAEQAAMKAA